MSRNAFLRRNLGETLNRFLPLLLALTVGAMALLISASTVGRAVSRSATALNTASALTVLRLDSVNPSGPSKPLTASAMESIRTIKGVEEVRPYAQFAIAVLNDEAMTSGPFWATPSVPWVQPMVTRSLPGLPQSHRLARGEIYLPDATAGVDNRAFLGKELRAEYTRATGPSRGEGAEITLRVVGLYDNSHPGADGESAAYVGEDDFQTLLGAQLGLAPGLAPPPSYGYPTIFVKVNSTQAIAQVQSALVGMGYPAESPAVRARALPGLLMLVSRLNAVVGGLLMLFCLGVGLSLGGTWSSLRRWDVGVLSSLGWSRGRILRTYVTEIALIGMGVALCSIALGGLGSAVIGHVLEGRTLMGATFAPGVALPSLPWVAAVAAGLPVALVLGSALRVLRLASLPPDVALRRRD